jgi:pilus assembly protein CpaB
VVGKTATVEVSPEQAIIVAQAAQAGQLSLSLRPLGDNVDVAALDPKNRKHVGDSNGPVQIIRYGMIGGRPRQQETAQ